MIRRPSQSSRGRHLRRLVHQAVSSGRPDRRRKIRRSKHSAYRPCGLQRSAQELRGETISGPVNNRGPCSPRASNGGMAHTARSSPSEEIWTTLTHLGCGQVKTCGLTRRGGGFRRTLAWSQSGIAHHVSRLRSLVTALQSRTPTRTTVRGDWLGVSFLSVDTRPRDRVWMKHALPRAIRMLESS